jgi:hypothetical protein
MTTKKKLLKNIKMLENNYDKSYNEKVIRILRDIINYMPCKCGSAECEEADTVDIENKEYRRKLEEQWAREDAIYPDYKGEMHR